MKLRTVVLIFGGAGIPLSLLAMLLPILWGYGGYNWNPELKGSTSSVNFVDPKGPAAVAGLHVGDLVKPPRGYDMIVEEAGPVGSVVHERVVRNGKMRVADIRFVPFFGTLGTQEILNKLLFSFTAVAAFLVAIIVVLRARNARVGSRAALILVLAGFGALCQAMALVCGSAWPAFILNDLLPPLISFAGVWALLALLAIYPPDRAELRRKLAYVGPLATAWGVLFSAASFAAYWYGAWSIFTSPTATVTANLLFNAVVCVAIFDAMAKASATYAVPMRWLGGMLLLSVVFGVLPDVNTLAQLHWGNHAGDILRACSVFCVAFGVAYPVLRYRLVDLNLLVSRATVFAVVSAIIVGIFIAAEWAIGKIFESSLSIASDRRGLAAQVASLTVVLVLGISARSIHRFVDERLSKTFFRKRIKNLAEIERVAHDADASTDAKAVMDLAVVTIQRCLEPLGAAFYLRRDNSYERASSAGAFLFPAEFAFNEAAPLRLRRWQEPFEIDDDSDERHHMLFIPMMLRGDVLGFLCCGPKPDRTAYLSDEIAVLSLLAHHAGIAAAWLNRAPMPAQSGAVTLQAAAAG